MAETESKEPAGLGETLGQAGTTVKDGIVGSIKGLGEIEGQMVTVARNAVADALQATGSVASETLNVSRDVIRGAIKASEEVGTGLIVTTKNVAKGIILGVADVGGDVQQAATQLLKGAVNGAAEVGGDVAKVAQGAISGVMEAAGQLGGNMGVAAKAAVGGAIDAAGTLGQSALRAVTDILVGAVEGVKEVACAALPKTGVFGGLRWDRSGAGKRQPPRQEACWRQGLRSLARPEAGDLPVSMIEAIHTAVHGRAGSKSRVCTGLTDLQRLLQFRLAQVKEITRVSASALTGNVLVCFNSGNTDETIATLLEGVVSECRTRLAERQR